MIDWELHRGCTPAGEGCMGCRIEQTIKELGNLKKPYAMAKPYLIDVNPKSDILHPSLDNRSITRVIKAAAVCTLQTFIVCTRRILRFRPPSEAIALKATPNKFRPMIRIEKVLKHRAASQFLPASGRMQGEWPPKNLFLGVSVSTQEEFNAVRARIRVLSKAGWRILLRIEPLLEQLWVFPTLEYVDWVWIGGESGGRARHCQVSWINYIIQQCSAASVPCYVLQLGAWSDLRMLHQPWPLYGRQIEQWPPGLRVREFPKDLEWFKDRYQTTSLLRTSLPSLGADGRRPRGKLPKSKDQRAP